MKTVPSYPKVLAVGAAGTEELFNGQVVIQEKVDGAQFGFGVNEEGELVFRSHRQDLYPGAAGQFEPVVQYLLNAGVKRMLGPDHYCYGECLTRPRHNTITYERTPKNNLVLFDALLGSKWAFHEVVETIAVALGIDSIPVLRVGCGLTLADIEPLLEHDSFLAGSKVEGVVVKNYAQKIILGGKVFPVFGKLVRTDFKESNKVNWGKESGKSKLEELLESCHTEARWQKAVQHLAEEGKLEGSPRDIGALIQEVGDDLIEEEVENIKQALWNLYRQDFLRTAQRGLPEWYKAKLAEEK